MKVHPNFIHEIPCTKIHDKVIIFMLVSSCVSYVGFISSSTIYFIDVLTCHEQQKIQKALFYQFCIPFIDRECLMMLKKAQAASISMCAISVGKGPSKFGVLSSLLSLSLVDMLDMLHVTYGGFSTYGSITSLQLASLGLLFCLLQLWSLLFVYFSLPFLGAFFL